MKLHNVASILRQEPLPVLIGEAAWRSVRAIRKWLFRLNGPGSCRVRFHPIGYFESQPEFASSHERESILAYADAVLRGKYPLMGYGCPPLGVAPDWHCDWVSGIRWPLETSENMQLVRHDGSDVKAPWELSRLQFAPVVAQSMDPDWREKIPRLPKILTYPLDREQPAGHRCELDHRHGSSSARNKHLSHDGVAMAI